MSQPHCTAQEAAHSHIEFNRGMRPGDIEAGVVGLSEQEVRAVAEFCGYHRRFEKARGRSRLELLQRMDKLLASLGLDDEQRRASILREDSFDIF